MSIAEFSIVYHIKFPNLILNLIFKALILNFVYIHSERRK